VSGLRRLIVFGDSWPRGHRRTDFEDGTSIWNAVEEPFPVLLGKQLGLETLNFAKSGNTNHIIGMDFWDYINVQYKEGDVVLFVWTEWNRMTLRDTRHLKGKVFCPNHLKYIKKGWWDKFVGVPWYGWQALRDNGIHVEDTTETVDDIFYKRTNSYFAYKMVQKVCEEKGIPYLSINSLESDGFREQLKVPDKKDPSRYSLYQNISGFRPCFDRHDPNWIEVENENNTLLDIVTGRWLAKEKKASHAEHKRWANNHCARGNFPLLSKDCFHPNEEGHEKITEVLLPYIKKLVEE
jgi:lysophospholipase L1-like esterase